MERGLEMLRELESAEEKDKTGAGRDRAAERRQRHVAAPDKSVILARQKQLEKHEEHEQKRLAQVASEVRHCDSLCQCCVRTCFLAPVM